MTKSILNNAIYFNSEGLWGENNCTPFLECMWHGANWTFVLWGMWHGLFSALEDANVIPKRLRESVLGHVYTMLVVVLGFTLFRADSHDCEAKL